jgi:8-amino-7-oxononanoate synthase
LTDSVRGVLEERMANDLDVLRRRSDLRVLEHPSGVDLCSNDYLNLARDARLKCAVLEAVETAERMGSTGSRLLSGNAREWEVLESAFADFAGTQAALYFSSGYSANVGLLSAVLRPGDIVFSDRLNHASLIDGMRLSGAAKVIYPHGDLTFLEGALRKHRGATGAKVIVTESLFSMEGDFAPLDQLARLARNYGAALVVDEAHATGVHGPDGRGLVVRHGIEKEVLATIHTCGKALASAGAFVCGGSELREYLVNHARTFVFSTAMPGYLARQIQAALDLARNAHRERAQLETVATLLRKSLAAAGLSAGSSASQIVPVLLGTNEAALEVAAKLRADGYAVKAIRPPTVPAGTARIRLSLTNAMRPYEVPRLTRLIATAVRSLPPSGSSQLSEAHA